MEMRGCFIYTREFILLSTFVTEFRELDSNRRPTLVQAISNGYDPSFAEVNGVARIVVYLGNTRG